MELLEIKREERLSREEAARRGVRFKLHVPDTVALKVELEIADDGTELEVELTW